MGTVAGGSVFLGLCLLAAVWYGASDFAGGLATRRSDTLFTLRCGEVAGLLLTAAFLPTVSGQITARGLLCATGAGVAGLVGLGLMYRLMASEPLNLVSPMTAVLAAVVPMAFGMLSGEIPNAVATLGILAGLVAVLLFGYTPDDPRLRLRSRVIGLAFLSGAGFGVYFILQARAGEHAGLWPLLFSRIVATALVFAAALCRPASARRPGRQSARRSVSTKAWAAGAGALDAAGDICFVLASRHGFLSLASVIVALYPAVTVVLAVAVLRERAGRMARVALALSALSLVLIAH